MQHKPGTITAEPEPPRDDEPVSLASAGRLPMAGDNVAIAIRQLEAGTLLKWKQETVRLPHTVLEGHRFAVAPIMKGGRLLSWELPFGTALVDIAPGDYICNSTILEVLNQRHVQFPIPEKPNFQDDFELFAFDEGHFRPGRQVSRAAVPRFFRGFARSAGRGVGTRNYIVIIGTSSRSASFARALAAQFQEIPSQFPNIDGVVAVAHTEGGGLGRPNNFDFVVRTLAGYCVHPNVGAFLAVDVGAEPITNAVLREFLERENYPVADVPHDYLSIQSDFGGALAQGRKLVKAWLERVNACARTEQPAEHLKVALQCGGSDAFSGISGNPLAGWVAKEVLRHGGAANLAETDELIGAETYVLSNAKDLETARKFVAALKRFQERATWHGHSSEGNPSGGNLWRGLYNITIKSIGAARKKDPEVCLDHVIAYGERMVRPGFYFMDSPGNDLESIAGQVAAGCNLILFTTGNGSITNFPFVPTIKIMTNSGRYRMLTQEMDVNAGAYQDGTPMDALGAECFERSLRVASGEQSAGEKAGHSQVQIWREWRQTSRAALEQIQNRPVPNGEPLRTLKTSAGEAEGSKPENRDSYWVKQVPTLRGRASEAVGLIVPTSLCSGQIGRMIAERLNAEGGRNPQTRFVALPHTEGCGASGGESEVLHLRTLMGYLAHPMVGRALVLEHGCEKTHNDALRNFLHAHGIDPKDYGWASVQLDGGIESVARKAKAWFESRSASMPEVGAAGLESARWALATFGELPGAASQTLAALVQRIVAAGGTMVVARNASWAADPAWAGRLGIQETLRCTLSYGEPFRQPGLHVMESPTDHAVETFTGLAATGVELILVHANEPMLQCHPLVPVLHLGTVSRDAPEAHGAGSIDLWLDAMAVTSDGPVEEILRLAARVLNGEYVPASRKLGNLDFQVTRGQLGVSL